jgi:hypothetical protein
MSTSVVVGLPDTFHGKAIQFGNEDVANCLNCHAPFYVNGFFPHRILTQSDPRSPVSAGNKLKTCKQAGCHAGAQKAFASGGRTHAAPPTGILAMAMGGGGEGAAADAEKTFEEWVLYLIRLFYQVLIAVAVGGLAMHRVLERVAHRREQRLKEAG